MQRITVTLPDDVLALARHEARRREISLSAVVRDAIGAHVLAGDASRELPFAAVGGSGRRSGARDLEEILEAEWGDDAGGR